MSLANAQHEAPKNRKPVLLALGVMTVAIVALLSVSDHPHASAVPPVALKTKPVAAQPPASESPWTYTHKTVEMTGERQDVACTASSEGTELCFRKTGEKLESYLLSPSGDQQFLCTKFHCTTEIKVDEQPVLHNVGGESPDGNLSLIYLGQPQQLLTLLQTAKQVALQPPMYDRDGLILHFHVEGLNGFGAAPETPAQPGTQAPGNQTSSNQVPENQVPGNQVSRGPVSGGHDPRLTAPITPVYPAQPKAPEPSPAIVRMGSA